MKHALAPAHPLGLIRPLNILCRLTLLMLPVSMVTAAPDLSGTWLPAVELSQTLKPEAFEFTDSGQQAFASFDSQRMDSTAFCMPYGTPRNTLNTAPDAIEILQRPEQITLIFDRLGDVRRIFMDGREHPDDPVPGWMGHSVAKWANDVLQVDTIGMTAESILTEQGLPHSDALHLVEHFSLIQQGTQTLLQIDMELVDPEYFSAPVKATRFFRQAPYAQMSLGSAVCLLDQWRGSLESFNRELYRNNEELEAAAQGAE